VRDEPRPEPPPPVVEEPVEPVVEEEPAIVVPEDSAAPEGGVACSTSRECGAEQVCRGPRGCSVAWACGSASGCGGDTIAYCDCDGQTFYAPIGCPGRAYVHPGACDAVGPLATAEELGIHDYDEPPTTEDRTCESNADCGRGEQCYGPPGCGMPWRCERLRGCAGARAQLCSCDGQTFRASLGCPGRPYAHRGECREGTAVASLTPSTSSDTHSSVAPVPIAPSPVTPLSITPTPVAPATLGPPPVIATGDRVCSTSRDCRRGEVCTGPPGCGETWICQRPRERCNPDTQVFCDCERNTFRASMNCPGQPFAHRGSCEIDRMLELSGASVR